MDMLLCQGASLLLLLLKTMRSFFSIIQLMGMGSLTAPRELIPPLSFSEMSNCWITVFSSLPFLILHLLPVLLFVFKVTLYFHLLHLLCEHHGSTGSALPSVFTLCGSQSNLALDICSQEVLYWVWLPWLAEPFTQVSVFHSFTS